MNKLRESFGIVFFLSLVWIAAPELGAQSGIFDRTGIVAGHGSYSTLPEESVDLFTGNVTLRYRDVFLPGPNGLDLEVWRVYNSKTLKDRQSGNPVVQAYHQSWVGMGWTMHMGMVHQETSSTPVVEFPDGRLETAFPDNYGANKHITRNFLKYDKVAHVLYFKDGTLWTFGATATITRADGTSDPVRLVTRIENPHNHHIDIVYDAGKPTIQTITDSTGRVVTFTTTGMPKKLTQIVTKDSTGANRIFSYSVGNYTNGYYRLESFTPPMLPATTFQYNDDASNGRYELIRLQTSYGGLLEFTYEDHTFYFSTIALASRVASQKKITFDPGNQSIWNFTYPTYQGVTSGTATVDGPLYDTSVVHHAYDGQYPWKVGLLESRTVSDGSAIDAYSWTSQVISTTDWIVLGINLGDAQGPLPSTVTRTLAGDSTVASEYLYERTSPRRYGLPTRVNTYINGSGSPKGYVETSYYFEGHAGFATRYMMDFPYEVKERSGTGTLLRSTTTTYFEETDKWGALKQVKKWKDGVNYYIWDYGYTSTSPELVKISVDPPGAAAWQETSYQWGVKQKEQMPDYTNLTRGIFSYDSSIGSTKSQFEAVETMTYDNAGRLTKIDRPYGFNDTDYSWPLNQENRVVITRGSDPTNTITRYWDGMGRDTGFMESASDATTLYSRKTLDAEGRVKSETKASTEYNPPTTPEYEYAYDASGRLTSITDPLNNHTTIVYANHKKTVTDALSHSTEYEYNDLPGLPTSVKDAKNYIATYTYDGVGRLTGVSYQSGARTHSYTYDGLDNVLTETHPETGLIQYTYDTSNRLAQKTWGPAWIGFWYDASNRLTQTQSAQGGIVDIVEYAYHPTHGAVTSVIDRTYGWKRYDITYTLYGKFYFGRVVIPGLGEKTVGCTYDANNNPVSMNGQRWTYNGLDMPKTVGFWNGTSIDPIVTGVTYGPAKQPTSVSFANAAVESTIYNTAGMPTSVTLARNGTTLYGASYGYDGVGNITSITGTTPPLNASFGYDEIYRLTSASYSDHDYLRPSTYSYEYDAYGNMTRVLEGANEKVWEFNPKNQITSPTGYNYDSRGNLTSRPDRLFFWDSQSRLQYVENTSGQVLGKYLYDDRGLRLVAVPPLPEINLKHDLVDIPSGGDAFLDAAVGQHFDETLTIENLGDANLTLGTPVITNDPEGNFSLVGTIESPVLPSDSTPITIRFQPLSAGHKSATLSIPTNDPDENPYLINLYGNDEPEISIPRVPDGGTLDFGEVEIGSFEQENFNLTNAGSRVLVLSGSPIVLVTGPDELEFTCEQQPISPVQPLGTTTFIIRFTPASEGPKTASISITNNDWNENPYDITFTGTGTIGPNKIDEGTAFVVTSPVEGETLTPGTIHIITWNGADDTKEVTLEYSTDNGSTFRTIVERTENTGSFPWLVPAVISGECLVRVVAADGPAASGEALTAEFKLKIASALEGTAPPTVSLHLAWPDPKNVVSWSADLVLKSDLERKVESLSLNAAGADCGSFVDFLDRWHTYRVLVGCDTLTASVWLDGKLILGGIPLVMGVLEGTAPEIVIGSEGLGEARVEDFEARYKDTALKAAVAGEIVSQALAKDSFELYPLGVFPAEGGWRLPGVAATQGTELLTGADQVKVLRPDRTDATLAQVRPESLSAGGTIETSTALVDDMDSATGLQSLRIKTDGKILVAKRLSLPGRVPFGVSEGAFSIAASLTSTGVRTISRARLLEARGRQRDEGRIREKEADQESASRVDGRARSRTSSRTPSGGTAKMMSASPVGNYYLYGFDGRLLQLYDVYGQLLKDYIYMGSRLVAEYDHLGARYLYYASDQINSTRMVTDGAGNVVYSVAHDPYGGIQKTWVTSYTPQLKFSGKERDTESELDYFGARYYDRSQYRFISVDPIRKSFAHSQRMNSYAYCVNNPISCCDPNGEDLVPCWVTLTPAPNFTVHQFLDSNFLPSVMGFLNQCSGYGIKLTFCDAYRTPGEHIWIQAANPEAAIGWSKHCIGWAIDVNWAALDFVQRCLAIGAAYDNGLVWWGETHPTDPGHFYGESAPAATDRAVYQAEMAYEIHETWNWLMMQEDVDDLMIYNVYGVFTLNAAFMVYQMQLSEVYKEDK